MRTMNPASAEEDPRLPVQRPNRWLSLAWSEWFIHSRLLLGFLIAWLLVVWFLPLVAHPLWILGHALLFALVAGPAIGGADVIRGSEEFAFAWPTTRRERFLSRAFVGVLSQFTFSLMGVLALEGDLTDVLLRVFVSSGQHAVQINQPLLLYGLVVLVPQTIFAFSFTLAALARSRTFALLSWLWGVLAGLAILRGTLQLEELRFDRLNGAISSPVLALVSTAILWVGMRFYSRKEAGTDIGSLSMPPGWWLSLAAVALALAAVTLLGFWLAENFSRLL